jgi:prepilin-type N-terminal cleavage/methylation domain-containing protein
MKIHFSENQQGHSAARSGARGRAAFSLMEVMVAVAVVGIVFVSLYAGITSGFGVINQARENLRATQVMQDRMEEMRLYTWEQISSFGTSTSYIPSVFSEPFYPTSTNLAASDINVGSAATNSGNNFTYFGTISITSAGLTESYSNDVKKVSVTLIWTNGVQRTRTMSTFFSQYGMQNYLY